MFFIPAERRGVPIRGHRKSPEKPTRYSRMRIHTPVISGKIR